MAHLKRYAMPRFWPLAVKEKTWAVRPMPGPHQKDFCIPLQIVVRDLLKYAETGREAKQIVKSGKIFVDKKIRREEKFPVGLMDVIEIPELKNHFRVLVDKNGLKLEKISEEEAGKKLCRINGKRLIKKNVIQLNLHDGRNIIVRDEAKKAIVYKPGDSLLISLPDQKILKHYRLEKSSPALIIAGKNMGVKGVIKEVTTKKRMTEKSTVVLKTDSGEIETLKDYVMAGEIK